MTVGFENSLGYKLPLPVNNGGTGNSSFSVPFGVLCGGTGSTTSLQNVASLGSATQLLTSNGASALPSFQNAPSSFPGTIVQVVYAGDTSQYSSTSSIPGYYTTGASITPTSISNHIIVLASVNFSLSYSALANVSVVYQTGVNLVRSIGGGGAATLTSDTIFYDYIGTGSSLVNQNLSKRTGFIWYDSIASLSTYNYAYYLQNTGGKGTSYINQNGQLSNFVLIEVSI